MSLVFHAPLPAEQGSGPLSRAAALPLSCGACVVAGVAFIAARDPARGGSLVSCPIRAVTGQWCPGCGLTRATHELTRGDILGALHMNVLTPLILGALVAVWLVWLRVATGHGVPGPVRTIRTRSYVAVGLFVLGFTVLRNLPGLAVLRGD